VDLCEEVPAARNDGHGEEREVNEAIVDRKRQQPSE
jgi:hypothetical protein